MPNKDPLMSSVAKQYETSKHVEGLLNRLANYMAGEIPDTADLSDLFAKKNDPANATATDDLGVDDATTNYTKDEPSLKPLQKLQSLKKISLEPIFKPQEFKNPDSIDADDYD